MTTTINASTSSGLVQTADTSGSLALQTASTTALTLDTSQNATFAGSVKTNTLTSASATALTLQSAGTTAITVDTSQNVGIGTTAPTARLFVSSAVAGYTSTLANSVTNAATLLKTNSSDSTVTSFGGISGGAGTIQRSNGAGTSAYDLALNPFGGSFFVGFTGGTFNDPGYNNVVGFVLETPSTTCTIKMCATDSHYFYRVGTGNLQRFEYKATLASAATNVGSISISASATAYNTSSDYRLKNTVAPMIGALAKVALLKPVTYKWNVDGSNGQGFIAHELQEVVPDCVTGSKDGTEIQRYEISPAVPATYDEEGNELTPAIDAVMGEREVPAYQGIDTSFLVATLTAAIQELKSELDELKAKVNA